jgi:hypothetical protein
LRRNFSSLTKLFRIWVKQVNNLGEGRHVRTICHAS